MTNTQLQEIADRTLQKIALQYGSTTRRDFRVIEIVMGELVGSGTQLSDAERANPTRRSEAP